LVWVSACENGAPLLLLLLPVRKRVVRADPEDAFFASAEENGYRADPDGERHFHYYLKKKKILKIIDSETFILVFH
jgi:hypothetical protein